MAKHAVPHVYPQDDVTNSEIYHFAVDTSDAQLLALSALRRTVASRSTEIVVNSIAVGMAVLAIAFAFVLSTNAFSYASEGLPKVAAPPTGWLALLVIFAGPFGMIVILQFLLFGPVLKMDIATQKAAARLAAYETELARRHAAYGREARRWQRAHVIDWR